MLYDRKQLPELNYMKHRHDDDDSYFNYENKILDKSLSPYMYENDVMNNFLKKTQGLLSILFDHMNIMKNFKNYMVDKYHYKQIPSKYNHIFNY
jgi:hypothetical protein